MLTNILFFCIGALISGLFMAITLSHRNRALVARLTNGLRVSEEKFKKAFHQSPIWVVISALEDGRYIEVNEAFLKATGYKRQEVIGRTSSELGTWVDPHERREIIGRIKEEGRVQNIELKRRMKDGRVLSMLFSGELIEIERESCLLSVSFDITQRRRFEEDLEYQKKALESLVLHSGLPIVELDTNHRVVSFNRPFEALFQFRESEIIGRNLDEVIARGEFLNEAVSHTTRSLEGRPIHGTGKRSRKDGSLVDVEFFGVPIIVHDKVVGAYGIYQDISERVKTREALERSEEKYRLLVENATDAIFIAQDGMLKFFNPRATALLGYSDEELATMPIKDTIAPEDREMVLERHFKRLGGDEPPSRYTFRILTRSGQTVTVELTTVLINWEGRPATLNFMRDITTQKKLEAQLHQAQRMESMGTLAGGIAHDFNNLLMAIQGRTSLMLMNRDSSHPDYEHLKGIESYVESAADLTRQLLGFARGGKYEVRPTDLNKVIRKQKEMFGRTRKEIVIHERYGQDLWPVEVDRGQMEQVLLNLFVNAWQAMPGGGNLYLETDNQTLDRDHVEPFQVEPGRYVRISVTDTGTGMDSATLEKIFEPFFTTKKMGRGTGLGLASCYGIVKNHGGFIRVYSEKGHGSTFHIYLPASKREVPEEEKPEEDLLKGTETVLIVDDEEMITEVAAELLEQLGYRVMTAGSGREAIAVFQENQEKIDAVILDMIMPDMDGGRTYDSLKEIDPRVRVLLSSGYSINGQAREILDRGCSGFIHKPFKIRELSQKLREVLG